MGATVRGAISNLLPITANSRHRTIFFSIQRTSPPSTCDSKHIQIQVVYSSMMAAHAIQLAVDWQIARKMQPEVERLVENFY